MVSPSGLSHNEIADRLSSTSENPQTKNRTPTPDSASAAAMLSKRREGERQERLVDQRPMAVLTFNQYVSSDGVAVAMGPEHLIKVITSIVRLYASLVAD